MKKSLRLITLVGAILTGLLGGTSPAFAQKSPFSGPWYFAADFNQWQLRSQTPNVFTFYPTSLCQANSPNGTFFPFKVGTPIFVQDSVAANSEVLTPSAIVNGAGGCGASVSATRQHGSFFVRSGTAGLQEALNNVAVAGAAQPAVIYLDRNWYSGVSAIPGATAAGVIAAAKGNAKAFLVDVTTAPFTYYTWSGTAYAVATYAGH